MGSGKRLRGSLGEASPGREFRRKEKDLESVFGAVATSIDCDVAMREASIQLTAERVGTWCKSHGYSNEHTKKKVFGGGTKFPLHTAVKYCDVDMVGLLLKCGVNRFAKDSKHQTPLQLAVKLNTTGSWDQIIELLA